MLNYIFEVFIYRLSVEKRKAEREKHFSKIYDPKKYFLRKEWNNLTEKEKQHFLQEKRLRFEEKFEGRAWKYNDIVGYIAIFTSRMQVKADYWYIEGRIRHDMKKQPFHFGGKAFEISLDRTDKRETIYKKVLAKLNNLDNEQPFKGRFIDTESFENLAPYVEWERLTKIVSH